MTRQLSFAMLLVIANFAWADKPVGWRTDGTGAYPKATPPITWAADKNVVWRTKMPGFSNATPVIVGEKLFTCSEPTTLLCVRLEDGKVLWQKENTYQDVVLSTEEQEKLKAEQVQSDKILDQIRQVEKERSALRKKLRDKPANKAELQEKIKALETQVGVLKTKLKEYPLAGKFRKPRMNGTGGFSSPTPTSDGRHVYVGFGNGLVVCFDLEGNRKWIKLIEHSTASYGHGASPLLVGDKLLVHYADLVALDIKDGSESWRVKLAPSHATPIHTRIGKVDVAITPNGQLVRIADGKVLAQKLGVCGPNSPLLHDGIVYFIRSRAQAVRLTSDPSADPELLWQGRLTGGGYWFASPVYHNGLVYGINSGGILSVVDAPTGKLVYEKRLAFTGRVYPSIALAGGLLFISSDKGATLVLQPGRQYKQTARNTLEGFRSTPVFQGKRMYIRTREHLYCIGE